MRISGIQAMLEMLAGCGVRYLFGNPGTTELPLSDAMVGRAAPRYILALQEIPAMAIADGYAQASGTPGVVNVHICCGLGNAMGMLYNAYREGTPLVVTAGQQDRRLMFEEPILWGDMVAVARPWTKWAAEVTQITDLPSAVRRAVQTAMTPPTGPVFLSLPLDVQTEEADLDVTPPRLPDFRVRPPTEAVRRAAAVLAEAANPGILVGSRVCEAGAVERLVAVAERLGAPVIHEATTSHGRSSFPSNHPLSAAPLPFWSPEVRERLAEFDVLLVAGMKLMQQYIYHEPARAVPEHIRLVHLDDDPWELGKNYPVEVGVIGHPEPSLAELASLLDELMTPSQVEAARARAARRAREHAQQRDALRREAAGQRDARPMTPLGLMDAVARVLPDDVAVVEEAPTTTMGSYLERVGALKNTERLLRPAGLGAGMGTELRDRRPTRLARPPGAGADRRRRGDVLIPGPVDRRPLQHSGHDRDLQQPRVPDPQGLRRVLGLSEACRDRFVGLDVDSPAIDYVGLAESLGVSACRAERPDELSELVRESLAGDRPRLIEASVRRPAGQ